MASQHGYTVCTRCLCPCDVCSLVHNEDREINVGVLLKQVADELKTQLRKIGSAFLGKGSQCPGSSVQVALIACETIE